MQDSGGKKAVEMDFSPGQVVRFRYKNWKGLVAERTARVESILYSRNEWHCQPQWLLRAFDLEKGEMRLFALKDVVPLDH